MIIVLTFWGFYLIRCIERGMNFWISKDCKKRKLACCNFNALILETGTNRHNLTLEFCFIFGSTVVGSEMEVVLRCENYVQVDVRFNRCWFHNARGGEWYLEKRGSRKILEGSRNLVSVFDKSRSLVFSWLVFTFFESRNFSPKSLGLGFLTRISASRRVSDFTIRHL